MNRAALSRWARHSYVELLGIALLIVGIVAVVQQVTEGTSRWWWATATWIITVGSIGTSKVRVPRHPAFADWAWRVAATGTVAGAAFAGFGPHLAAGVGGLVGMLGYQGWYARQHRPTGGFEIGHPMPEFPLVRIDGTPTTSAELADQPHVLVFYRGAWCPFCVAQIDALAASYRDLDERGVRVALISPQPAGDTVELARRFDVPMRFYVDPDGVAARLLDIVQAGGVPLTYSAGTDGDTVVPTVVVTDRAGHVTWVRHAHDHRVRPDPATLLAIIDDAAVSVT